MKSDNNCSGCDHKEGCRLMYEKLGNAKGPNVAWKVFIAFLVPIAVFIGALVAAQHFLQNRFEEKILTLISFFLAICLTLVVVFIIRALNGPVKKEDIEKR